MNQSENHRSSKEENYEALKLLIYEVADAVAKKYVDALLECDLPKTLKDEISSRIPVGVAAEEILSRFPLYQVKARLDL